MKTTQEQNETEEERLRILIVEDQLDTLRSLERAASVVFPAHYQTKFRGYDVARSFNNAQNAITNQNYDFVLLDHRMPENPMTEPEIIRNGGSLSDLTGEQQIAYMNEEDRVSRLCEGIGYTLIPKIRQRNPRTVIIGTSSMNRELESMPKPNYQIRKFPGQAEEDLEKVLAEEVRKGR